MSNTDTDSEDEDASEEEIDPRYSLKEEQMSAIGLNEETVKGKYYIQQYIESFSGTSY